MLTLDGFLKVNKRIQVIRLFWFVRSEWPGLPVRETYCEQFVAFHHSRRNVVPDQSWVEKTHSNTRNARKAQDFEALAYLSTDVVAVTSSSVIAQKEELDGNHARRPISRSEAH